MTQEWEWRSSPSPTNCGCWGNCFSRLVNFCMEGHILKRQREEEQLQKIQRETRETKRQIEQLKKEMKRMKKEKRELTKKIRRQERELQEKSLHANSITAVFQCHMERGEREVQIRHIEDIVQQNALEIQKCQQQEEELERQVDKISFKKVLRKQQRGQKNKTDLKKESLLLLQQIQEETQMKDLWLREREEIEKKLAQEERQREEERKYEPQKANLSKLLDQERERNELQAEEKEMKLRKLKKLQASTAHVAKLNKDYPDFEKEKGQLEEREREEMKRKQEKMEKLEQLHKKLAAQLEMVKETTKEREMSILGEMEKKKENERQEMERLLIAKERQMEKELEERLKEGEMKRKRQKELEREQEVQQRQREQRLRDMERKIMEERELAIKREEEWREIIKRQEKEWALRCLEMKKMREEEMRAEEEKAKEVDRHISEEREREKLENEEQKTLELKLQERELEQKQQELDKENRREEQELKLSVDFEEKDKKLEKQKEEGLKQVQRKLEESQQKLEERKQEMEKDRDMPEGKSKEMQEHLRDVEKKLEERREASVKPVEELEKVLQLRQDERKGQREDEQLQETVKQQENELLQETEKQKKELIPKMGKESKEELLQETEKQREKEQLNEWKEKQLDIEKIRVARVEHMEKERQRKKLLLKKMFSPGYNFFRAEEGIQQRSSGCRRSKCISEGKQQENTDEENKQQKIQRLSWPVSPNGEALLINVKPLNPSPEPAQEPSPVDQTTQPTMEDSVGGQESSTGPEETDSQSQTFPEQHKKTSDCSGDKLRDSEESLKEFVLQPFPTGVLVKCCIERDRSITDSPTYHMFQETEDGMKKLLLVARKVKHSKTSTCVITLAESDKAVGQIRSSRKGTEFTLYDNGRNPDLNHGSLMGENRMQQELVSVCYVTNGFGLRKSKHISAVVPMIDMNLKRVPVYVHSAEGSLLKRLRNNKRTTLCVLKSKTLKNKSKGAYELDFQGRVIKPSMKNFQLIHPDNPNATVLQFGRLNEDQFALDYSFPMCALQAFAIALSSFDDGLIHA